MKPHKAHGNQPDLVFYVNKPKARRLATTLFNGARRMGYRLIITETMAPRPNSIGIFYGVVPETFSCFQFYRAEGKAIYLDNGWLSTRETPTFRFSWNSVQAFLSDMTPDVNWKHKVSELPVVVPNPIPARALLILQSAQYFDFMRLGYTRGQWERVTTKILQDKGYTVERREKPTSKGQTGPNFFDQMARAGIVVSLNSAATVKALRYGIPAFCMLDCTPSPLAPVRLPQAGKAAPPDPAAVATMCARLMDYEITLEQLDNGAAIESIMGVQPEHRRGYVYAT